VELITDVGTQFGLLMISDAMPADPATDR